MSVEIKIIRKATKHEEEEVIKRWDIDNGYVSESIYPKPGDMVQVHSHHFSGDGDSMYKVLNVVHYFDDSTDSGPVDEIRVYVKKLKNSRSKINGSKKKSSNIYEDALDIARETAKKQIESDYHKKLTDMMIAHLESNLLTVDDVKVNKASSPLLRNFNLNYESMAPASGTWHQNRYITL